MRRYKFLKKDALYAALNRLRAALLAAEDGHDVENIMLAVLSHDERIKIGRRIEIAEMIRDGVGYDEIRQQMQVGKGTIANVVSKLEKYPDGYNLINRRI
ncbi:hypothetical protein JXA63_03015 [Candidatus Woesebacteria bacterium]|nr:hypothetical protein [Candidatus Woesebacteria bacterium]